MEDKISWSSILLLDGTSSLLSSSDIGSSSRVFEMLEILISKWQILPLSSYHAIDVNVCRWATFRVARLEEGKSFYSLLSYSSMFCNSLSIIFIELLIRDLNVVLLMSASANRPFKETAG